MKFPIKSYILAGFISMFCALSCADDDDYEQATVTFYPALESAVNEPAEGSAGLPVHVQLLTSRVLATNSQVNIRIAGAGAGYGFSYLTNPAMLQPGILTLTIPAGENTATFDFIPRNDGLFVPDNYKYTFTIEATSNSVKSVGQGQYKVTVQDQTAPFLSFDFNTCGDGAPAGFTEVRPGKGNSMTANVWGCTDFGYPNKSTQGIEANAYGKGGTVPSNNYLVMNTPITAANYSQLYISALVQSFYPGKGQLKFLYSTNYSGSGAPDAEGVVWNELTEINAELPGAGTKVWQPVSQLFESPGTGDIYIAVQFTGGESGSSSNWQIDNLEFKGI